VMIVEEAELPPGCASLDELPCHSTKTAVTSPGAR
jgi:hypothetical protein